MSRALKKLRRVWLLWFGAGLAALFVAVTVFGQVPPAQDSPTGRQVFVAPTPTPAPYPELTTETQVAPGKTGKPTAGDLVELRVMLPPNEPGLVPNPDLTKKLSEGPAEWGVGRILWWKKGEGSDQGKLIFGLTTYAPGKFDIPGIPLVREQSPATPVFASQPQQVEFSAIGGDKSKDDIYPPENVGFPQWLVILLGVLALASTLAVIWGLSVWYRKRKDRIESLAAAPRVLDPLEEFEKRRIDTERKGFLEKELYKPHYFALSDSAKRFLGRSYRFNAEERTTRELVMELEGLGMTSELIDQWEQLFNEMDVTKFTDQRPEREPAKSLSNRLATIAAKTYRTSPAGKEALIAAAMTPNGLPGSPATMPPRPPTAPGATGPKGAR